MSNTPGWTSSDWEFDIGQAQAAKIDGFALNIAHGESINEDQLPNAFQVAGNKGFKLIFSFDYAGGDASS